MNSGCKVLWTEVAKKDLGDTIEFIAFENPAHAMKILKKIRQKAAKLVTCPERGRIVPELHAQGIFIYRELVVYPWRLIYRIADSSVYVLSLLDGRRNVEDILLHRLISQ
ncbi:MAG: type II toxin-antitoxin system RelE/ParE family toxin [Chlorobiaceae bacterium]